MLRRTKAEVAPELPARQIIDVACTITTEQRRLYETALAEAFDAGLGSGASRRASVLALLTRLKQVCNHPAQARGQHGPLPERSGKFDRTADMLDETITTGRADAALSGSDADLLALGDTELYELLRLSPVVAR